MMSVTPSTLIVTSHNYITHPLSILIIPIAYVGVYHTIPNILIFALPSVIHAKCTYKIHLVNVFSSTRSREHKLKKIASACNITNISKLKLLQIPVSASKMRQ